MGSVESTARGKYAKLNCDIAHSCFVLPVEWLISTVSTVVLFDKPIISKDARKKNFESLRLRPATTRGNHINYKQPLTDLFSQRPVYE